jgi:hypothetical protein
MPKPKLREPYYTLENEIIRALLAGYWEYRQTPVFPDSGSDMQAAARGLLRVFEVRRRPLVIELPLEEGIGEDMEKDKP